MTCVHSGVPGEVTVDGETARLVKLWPRHAEWICDVRTVDKSDRDPCMEQEQDRLACK